MRYNNYFTYIITMIILFYIFRIFWPIILLIVVGIILYSLYIKYKLNKDVKQESINEKYNYDSWSNDFEYNNSNNTQNSDVIDVVYKEHEE